MDTAGLPGRWSLDHATVPGGRRLAFTNLPLRIFNKFTEGIFGIGQESFAGRTGILAASIVA